MPARHRQDAVHAVLHWLGDADWRIHQELYFYSLSRAEALLDACHKRARPIVMTTIAMVAGMIPLVAVWGSVDNSSRAPMAAAVIGGLITSTILSLLVTPSPHKEAPAQSMDPV